MNMMTMGGGEGGGCWWWLVVEVVVFGGSGGGGWWRMEVVYSYMNTCIFKFIYEYYSTSIGSVRRSILQQK